MLEAIGLQRIFQTKAERVFALREFTYAFPEKGLVFILGKSGAQAARILRLTRLRLTAQPSFFPTEKPTFSAPART